MTDTLLKCFFFSFFVFLLSFAVQSQEFKFIYIETENQTPFYCKIAGQSFSSTASGYVIIPKLTGGIYKMVLGFPHSEIPVFFVSVDINETDAGYLIKKDIDQSRYLVDLITNQALAIEKLLPKKHDEITIINTDEFAKVLAQVVNDSTICYSTTFRNSEADKAIRISTGIPTETVMQNKVEDIFENKPGVSNIAQKNIADTIREFSPANKPETLTVNKEKTLQSDSVTNAGKADKEVRFINMELQNPNLQTDSGVNKKDDFVITQKKAIAVSSKGTGQKDSITDLKTGCAIIKTTCKKTATQTDFLLLRKKMAAEKSETGMRQMAVKHFKKTCFTTEQVKNLGLLFIKEEERYKFYVSAFPYVLDVANFATLETQFAGIYHKNRFKAMFHY
jgi:hypothetical protein